MKMNMNEWVMNIKKSSKRVAIPIMTHPGIDLIGKKVVNAVKDGEVHFNAIKALQELYPSAAATIIMDLTVEAEAFGCNVNFSDDEVPSIAERIVSDKESIDKLKVPTIEAGRIKEYIKATKLASTAISDRPVIAGCIGPYSLAGRLFDMTEIMTAIYLDPEIISTLLEKCTAFLILYIKEMKETGANGIVVAEPAAGLLSEDMCEMFSSIYVKKIVKEVQDENFMVILHNCGNTGQVTTSMVNTGAAAFHFGNKIDIIQTLKEVPNDRIVMGNLDPVGVFKAMTAADVKITTKELLDATKQFNNFIISSGCDTPPGVPIENIRAFYEAVKEG